MAFWLIFLLGVLIGGYIATAEGDDGIGAVVMIVAAASFVTLLFLLAVGILTIIRAT